LSDLSITYKIDLEKCEDFRINEEELINNLWNLILSKHWKMLILKIFF
jgi:hypothetical protein